jgi:hypothetical protein
MKFAAMEEIMKIHSIQQRLSSIARDLATEKRGELDELKRRESELDRPDFLWHYLLQSFATMGRVSGWDGLIGNMRNYEKLKYESLLKMTPGARARHVQQICVKAKVRMPNRKTSYILRCFEQVKSLGGPELAKQKLLAEKGKTAKISFLKQFHGIGDKYARNIMMDVYHQDFRDSIAVDARIRSFSAQVGLSFNTYEQYETFYKEIAKSAGINAWELDRILFNYGKEFLKRI